jgi:hypothetical protein
MSAPAYTAPADARRLAVLWGLGRQMQVCFLNLQIHDQPHDAFKRLMIGNGLCKLLETRQFGVDVVALLTHGDSPRTAPWPDL